MKDEFTNYLKAIDMTDVLISRIEVIYQFYHEICPEEILSIFVTDFFKEEGTREYENLWFFSQSLVMEAKQFITKDEFDMMLIHKRIVYWSLEKQEYDFKKATDKSRLRLVLHLTSKLGGDFKASKNNCDFLNLIIHKHIIPNFQMA